MAFFESSLTVLALIAVAHRGFATPDLTMVEEMICKGALSDMFKIGVKDGMTNFTYSFSNLSVTEIERIYAPVDNESKLARKLSLELALAYFKSLFGDFEKVWNNNSKKDKSSLIIKDENLGADDPGSSSDRNVLMSPRLWCESVAAKKVLAELDSEDSTDDNWSITVRYDLEIDSSFNGRIINGLIEYCKMHLSALQLLNIKKVYVLAVIDVLRTAYEKWSFTTLTYEGITGYKPLNLNDTSTVKMMFYIKKFSVRYFEYLQEFVLKELLSNAEEGPIKFTSVGTFCRNQGRKIVNKSSILQKINRR